MGYYSFHIVYLISLWRHNVCFENGFEVFCKGNTCISKKENLLRSFLTILEQKWVEFQRELVRNDGKGFSKA